MTVSFHKFGDFFPGTGDVRDTGMKKGKGYAVNVPLKDGVGEKEFSGIFRPVSAAAGRVVDGTLSITALSRRSCNKSWIDTAREQ